ncbi:MAG: ketopantoate reductase family protein [Acidaminococcaceae bacterium]|nr:ketopantoate reductase family protein [Acidaminococcaceae bacterium]
MEIKSVAILGAGAIGAYFIYGFTAADIDFCLVAKGERKERLQREGICINGKIYRPAVKTPEEARGVDLLLVSVKYNGLRGALEDIRTVTAPNTTVLSLLNGIDSEEIISTVIDPAQIVYSLMRINSERDGSSVTFNAEKAPGLFVGEKDSAEESERLLAIRALLEKTPLKYNFREDIIADQWLKYALNIAYNLPQAVLGVGYAAYFDSDHVGFIRDRLEAEARQVAAAYGITFGPLENTRPRWLEKARFSTLQDLEAKRHTEIDMFCKVLMEKAAAKGIPVPFAEYTCHAIKALEEKNDGKFDYK